MLLYAVGVPFCIGACTGITWPFLTMVAMYAQGVHTRICNSRIYYYDLDRRILHRELADDERGRGINKGNVVCIPTS